MAGLEQVDWYVPHEGPLSLPRGVRAVFGVHGQPFVPRPRPARRAPDPPIITPHALRGLYKVNSTGSRATRNRQAVIEVMGQTMKVSDLASFFAQYVPAFKQADTVYKFVGEDGRGGVYKSQH